MNDPKQREHMQDDDTIACEICMKEIPKDLSQSEESTEYVYHFCGSECYDKWKEEKK